MYVAPGLQPLLPTAFQGGGGKIRPVLPVTVRSESPSSREWGWSAGHLRCGRFGRRVNRSLPRPVESCCVAAGGGCRRNLDARGSLATGGKKCRRAREAYGRRGAGGMNDFPVIASGQNRQGTSYRVRHVGVS